VHAHVRLRGEGVKIGEIRDVRQLHHGNIDGPLAGAQVFATLQRHAVFVF
jgi:hypothetical protein